MQSPQALILPDASTPQISPPNKISFPDHTQLPETDGTFVKNFQ